ncbi:MAG TPA: carbamate kinase [Planctomycetes bacterium]|nr:carbamate kinase [Planctomycetota bacterium]
MAAEEPSPYRPDGGAAVLAFGGNALLPDPYHPEDQDQRAEELAAAVLRLLQRSSGIVLVHGNGPQVGMILLRVEETRERLPGEPLDVLVAETQGSIGYLLSRALSNALHACDAAVGVSTVLTQVLVDERDPAFERPEKPVGPFYAARTAQFLKEERGWRMVEEASRGWRRVVASPRPTRVIEMDAIAHQARTGGVVVAGGGGGIPVVERGGALHGVEAVIDKDRTSALIASELPASTFVLLTGVPHVVRGFGTPNAEPIARLTRSEALALVASGEFPPGSMGPKVEAACSYVAETARPALICDAAGLESALEGIGGTWIVPDPD